MLCQMFHGVIDILQITVMIRSTVRTKKVMVRRVPNVRPSFRGSTMFSMAARLNLVRFRA